MRLKDGARIQSQARATGRSPTRAPSAELRTVREAARERTAGAAGADRAGLEPRDTGLTVHLHSQAMVLRRANPPQPWRATLAHRAPGPGLHWRALLISRCPSGVQDNLPAGAAGASPLTCGGKQVGRPRKRPPGQAGPEGRVD